MKFNLFKEKVSLLAQDIDLNYCYFHLKKGLLKKIAAIPFTIPKINKQQFYNVISLLDRD